MHSFLLPLVPQSEPQGSPHLLPEAEVLSPWYDDLIINPPSRTALQYICLPKLVAHLPWKTFRKRFFVLYRGHYALAPLENTVGVYAPSIFAQKCRLKLVNILNLAKTIVWQNRSMGWGITLDLECFHLNNTRALHWNLLTSSWSSFLFSILNSNKTIAINNIGWLADSVFNLENNPCKLHIYTHRTLPTGFYIQWRSSLYITYQWLWLMIMANDYGALYSSCFCEISALFVVWMYMYILFSMITYVLYPSYLCKIWALCVSWMYLNLSYNLRNLSRCLTSKIRTSIGLTFIKIKHKMKWMIKVLKTINLPPLSSYMHSFLNTTKLLEKIRLHMVFTLFVNILKKFFEQTKI